MPNAAIGFGSVGRSASTVSIPFVAGSMRTTSLVAPSLKMAQMASSPVITNPPDAPWLIHTLPSALVTGRANEVAVGRGVVDGRAGVSVGPALGVVAGVA